MLDFVLSVLFLAFLLARKTEDKIIRSLQDARAQQPVMEC